MARQTIERRVEMLEEGMSRLAARVGELDDGYGEAIYRTDRNVVGLEITLSRVAAALNVAPASEEEIDASYDERS
ncbi:hypothetical protein ACFYTQ_18995 [Nocardia sp. NPDC004068]|uniref:hypothetical protein n=1 Tax=Nocardia sp. NPDC004068 TaxID=3364303 RepID=UPI0036C7B3BA